MADEVKSDVLDALTSPFTDLNITAASAEKNPPVATSCQPDGLRGGRTMMNRRDDERT